MRVIIIRNYKKKLVIFSVIFVLWLLTVLASSLITNSGLFFHVTINDYLSFSHPYSLKVENIFVNDKIANNAVKTSMSFSQQITQKFSTYKSFEGKFSFDYPSMLTLIQKDFAGSDILYHIDLQNKTHPSHGFVQVWNLPHPLKKFLEKSKASSQQDYKYFESVPVSINDIPGYHWSYSVKGTDDKYYKGNEVFLQKGEKMYRISYFVPENLWNESQSKMFWKIVNSFKVY